MMSQPVHPAVSISTPQAGPLQILTRRAGNGVGDGVNIQESTGVGADYRGQRYAIDEAVFHTPGLHVFPGQSDVYPAEYHIHMRTFTEPQRSLTIVIPVTHKEDGPGKDYFAAASARPDPAVQRPTLSTLMTPNTSVLTYRGPDLRGRTSDTDGTCQQNEDEERQILLVLSIASIRASDLERIPREGSLNTAPENLPAPGIKPSKTVLRDRILRCAVLAKPGILGAVAAPDPPGPVATHGKELECRPIKVVGGRDVVDISGQKVDVLKLLGIDGEGQPIPSAPAHTGMPIAQAALMFIGTFFGLLIADWILGHVWGAFFVPDTAGRLFAWEPLKVVAFISISSTAAFGSDNIVGFLDQLTG
jgi:hypothetical protein